MSDPRWDAGAEEYSADNAHFLAWASELAYSTNKASTRKALRTVGFRKCRTLDGRGTQLFVAANAESIVVAFRGTETRIEDWMTDAKVTLTGGPLGMVHEGFAIALGDVWPELAQSLDDYQDGGQGIWITGHSLGAALATLATAKLLERARPVRALYTYGSPRCGDGSFARSFDALFRGQTYRFVHDKDVVTRVPPRLGFGYRHVGQTCFLTEAGELRTTEAAWQGFVDSVRGTFDDFRGAVVEGVEDHAIARYVERLDALRSAS